jgi:hypothetical protein
VKTETEAAWAERVEEWRKSGKTATEFAADKPYAGSTLQWAASRLRRGASGRRRRRAWAGDIALAKVVRRPRPGGTVAEVVVEVAGARISVRRGFDATLLSSVVQALKEER